MKYPGESAYGPIGRNRAQTDRRAGKARDDSPGRIPIRRVPAAKSPDPSFDDTGGGISPPDLDVEKAPTLQFVRAHMGSKQRRGFVRSEGDLKSVKT